MVHRYTLIRTVLNAMGVSKLHRLLAPVARGRGVILTLHHIRPWRERAFAPNRILEITPEFLDIALSSVRREGFDLVDIDEGMRRLSDPGSRRFCVVTADDGYRDNIEHAMPVMRRHGAPLTIFVTTGFADRSASLWWLDLEEAIARRDHVVLELEGEQPVAFDTATAAQKIVAFDSIYSLLRQGPEERLRAGVASLARKAAVPSTDLVNELCMDWTEIVAASRDPLVRIGTHTVNHFMLARHDEAIVRSELSQSRRMLEERIGLPIHDAAFPVGGACSAGPREFSIARELGFRTALTTRPGHLYDYHLSKATALPRVSLNGCFQRKRDVEVLLSGAPFLLTKIRPSVTAP